MTTFIATAPSGILFKVLRIKSMLWILGGGFQNI